MRQVTKKSTVLESVKLVFYILSFSLISQTAFGINYYNVLGVSQSATETEIKAAYRKLAMKYHPDRHVDESAASQAEAEAKFKEIKIAYEALSGGQKGAQPDMSDIFKTRESTSRLTPDEKLQKLDDILKNLREAVTVGPKAVSVAIENLAINVELLIETGDQVRWQWNPDATSKFYKEYNEVMSLIGKSPKLATPEVLSSLMFLNAAQETVYGMRVDLHPYEGGFDIDMIAKTVGSLLKSAVNLDAKELFRALAIEKQTYRAIILEGYINVWKVHSIFSLDVAPYLYEFGIRKGLIRGATSLIVYINEMQRNVLVTSERESVVRSMLEANMPFTLSTLSSASYQEIDYILKNLSHMNIAVAYEEIVRNGRLEKLTADQVLQLLKTPRAWIEHLRKGRFGGSYDKLAEDMAAKLKRANLAFAREFNKKSPSPDQVKEFIELSEFKFGEYTWGKIRPSQLPERNYKVFTGSLVNVHEEKTSLPGAKPLGLNSSRECKSIFLK